MQWRHCTTNSLLRTSVKMFALLLLASTLQAAKLEITYLANEGVLIACDGQKVLVDALLRDSLDDYARHPPDVQEKLETGKPPFDGIVLALATHFHLDHWDAGAISRFLKNNSSALFVSTPEATAMLPWSHREQVRAVWPETGESEEIERGGVKITASRLQHGNTQNLGYRISMCGQTVFHLGDAQGSEEDFATLQKMPGADVALVPYWWLLDVKSAGFLHGQWKPRHIVALHLATHSDKDAKELRDRWPEAWVCRQQGERRKY